MRLSHTAAHDLTVPYPGRSAPSVSVIMPCYNAAPYIESALRSVLDQAYDGDIEVLVVDDGSIDDSIDIASGFDRVRVMRQAHQGPAAARNLGLRAARGALIAFLDADDRWTPGSLAARVGLLVTRPDIAVVFGNFTRWHPGDASMDDGEVPDALPPAVLAAAKDGWLYPDMLLDPIVHIITALVRREVIDAVGPFDPRLRTGEDYDFWIRVAQQHRFARLADVVARYRIHPGGTTRVPRADNNEYIVVQRALTAYGARGHGGRTIDSQLLAQRLHHLCFDHAYMHFWHGDASVAALGFRRALAHDPWRAKTWVYAFLSAAKSALRPQRATTGGR